jgi:hypothetical protein
VLPAGSQLVKQAPLWQTKGLQLAGGSLLSWQAPAPLQTRPCTDVPPATQTPPQLAPCALGLQAPLPSHLPVVPQGLEPVSSLQLSESDASSGTLAQVPCGFAQLLHVPQLALAQQVPSTQLPEPHSLPEPQPVPSAFLPQLPSPQVPTEQSSSLLQVWRQALAAASQRNGAHDCIALAGQLPSPSQNAASESALAPAGQAAARHTVLVPHFRQAPAPLQLPSLPQLLSAEGAQPPWGSPPPEGTLLQVPSDPGTAQLLQVWPQAVPQHTPSTQKPVVHSGPSLQLLPVGLVPQRPLASQRLGGWHWPLSLQELKQSVPSLLQTKGAQAAVAPATQVPAPSQLDTSVRVPAVQEAERQGVPGA